MTKLTRNLKVFFSFGLSVFIPYYAYIPYKKWKKKLIAVDDTLYSVHEERNECIAKSQLYVHTLFHEDNLTLLLKSEEIQRRIEMLKDIKDVWWPWSKWYIVYYYLLQEEYMKQPKLMIKKNEIPRVVMHAVGGYYAEVLYLSFFIA